MSQDAARRRLVWKCRRGMRELDVVLTRYLECRYPAADSDEKAAFERLLECQDPLIFAWLTARDLPSDAAIQRVVEALRSAA